MAKKRPKMSNTERKYRDGLIVGISGGFVGSFFASALFNFAITSNTADWVRWFLFAVGAFAFFYLIRLINTQKDVSWD